MDMHYRNGPLDHMHRGRLTSKNLPMNPLQQEMDIERLKEVEHQREQLEKKCDELRVKHSDLEQREKDLRMKMAFDAYEQLCLNIGNEGRSSIRHLLVNLCQAEFERNFEAQLMMRARAKKIAQADKEVKNELEALFEKEYQFAQIRAKGNIWMIGELYNYGILSDNMILYFISRLMDEYSAESWPWLCELILTVHTSLIKNEVDVGKYFKKIKEILKTKTQLSNDSETVLQHIILDWEAKIDPERIAALAEEKVPDSEPVTYKPVVCTVQSYEKANSTIEHKPYKDFNNKQQLPQPPRGKSRGRFRGERGFTNGAHSYGNMHNRGAAYSSIGHMNPVDGYNEWYEQNMCAAYGFPKYRPFNDPFAHHGMWQGKPEVDMRGEQKTKKKPRQQQTKVQEMNSVIKKELLDGEMKIGFRKQTLKKQEGDSKSAQNSVVGTSKTATASSQESKSSDTNGSRASPQHKLLSALGASVEDISDNLPKGTDTAKHSQTIATDVSITSEIVMPAKANLNVPKSKKISPETKSDQSSDDDPDVLILSETVTEEEGEVTETLLCSVKKVGSPKIGKTTESQPGIAVSAEGGVAMCEYSSGASEYSSPMHSPVPCESKEKSNEIWSRLSLLPHPRGTTPTSADHVEKVDG